MGDGPFPQIYAMSLIVSLLVQSAGFQPPLSPATYQILRAEHARGADLRPLDSALVSGNAAQQRLAVRAIGRFEQTALEPKVIPLLTARSAGVRREAVYALGQMRSRFDLATLLTTERDASVRAAIYETLGRLATAGESATATAHTATAQRLAEGLRESPLEVRAGAARGMESLLRRTARQHPPGAETLQALRDAVRRNTDADTRQLLLLALTAANDRDAATVALALRDTSAEVRRVAVALGRQWVNDRAPMVRWQALRVAGTCARAAAHVRDTSEHVALLALDLLGDLNCTDSLSQAALEGESRAGASWRHQAHAAVSMAKVAPARASAVMQRLAASTTWQARVYAANTARRLQDSAMLELLSRDAEPNVAIAAMTTREHALRALSSTHAGLVLAAATQLKRDPNLSLVLPQLRAAFDRFTAMHRVSLRDPRAALLERIGEAADSSSISWLRERLTDADPAIAASAATYLSTRTGTTVPPGTSRYEPAPFPSIEALRGLAGATATMRVKGVGTVELAFRFGDAPMAVHTFVSLAAAGKFNGLTFHRIVPNFVIQGGSPGADEYDPLTDTFMRDEVGTARNNRGSLGISTRGRDTGDGQIYVNLVNNFRLDRDYTVFANVTRGLAVIDRVREGDVIESIVVHRSSTSAPRRP